MMCKLKLNFNENEISKDFTHKAMAKTSIVKTKAKA